MSFKKIKLKKNKENYWGTETGKMEFLSLELISSKYFFISFTKEISSLSLDLERQMLTFIQMKSHKLLHVWRSAV